MLSRCHLKSEAPLTEKIAQNANIETTTAVPTTRKFLDRAIPINAHRSARGKTNPYCQGESMQQTTISFAAKRDLAALALDTGRNPSSEAPQILQPTCQAKGPILRTSPQHDIDLRALYPFLDQARTLMRQPHRSHAVQRRFHTAPDKAP